MHYLRPACSLNVPPACACTRTLISAFACYLPASPFGPARARGALALSLFVRSNPDESLASPRSPLGSRASHAPVTLGFEGHSALRLASPFTAPLAAAAAPLLAPAAMNNDQVQAAIHAAVQQQLAAALQQQHAAAPAAAAPPAPRLAPPPPFDGRANALDAWLPRMAKQFAWYRYGADAHEQRIRLAMTCFEGAALDWWLHNAQQPQTWDALVTALRARFQPITAATAARTRLMSLTQGRAPVHDYVSVFRRLLVAVPDMAEADRLFHFKRGLQPAIATQLNVAAIERLDAAIDAAVRVGSAHASGHAAAASAAHAPMELDAMLDGIEGLEPSTLGDDAPVTRSELQHFLNAVREQRRTAPPSSAGAGSDRRSSSAGRFMRGPPRVPHLTASQVEEYMAAGKCFGCGKTDHAARQCPKRKQGADGKVSWSN